MRILMLTFSLFVLCISLNSAWAQNRTNPLGSFTDNRGKGLIGKDFHSEVMQGGQRASCLEACRSNPLCKGYVWTRFLPQLAEATPNCRLFYRVDEVVTAGLKDAGVRAGNTPVFDGTREPNIELRGETYLTLELPRNRSKMCRDACAVEGRCVGYVHFKPGRLSPNSPPTCRLMTEVTDRRESNCCVSGARRDSFVTFRFHPDTKMQFLLGRPFDVADVKTCVELCRGDEDCDYALYRKTTATRPVGECTLSEQRPVAISEDGGYTAYERAPPDYNMHEPREGVAAIGNVYREVGIHADPDKSLSLCRESCGSDAACRAANFFPATAERSAQCAHLNSTSSNRFQDGVTSNNKPHNTSPASIPGPNSVSTRLVFSGNDPLNVVVGDRYPRDMPEVRFPVNWGGCSVDDRYMISRAWARAHYNVWRARQVMTHLASQSTKRADMWAWSFDNQMGTDPNYNNISPRAYFGKYDNGRFHDVRRVIDKLFVKRFRGKTFKVNCRARDGGDGAHPCEIADANANHIIYGRINFCNNWFEKSDFYDQVTIVTHEMLHWMKIPKSVYWVADRHDFWRSCRKYRTVRALYDDDAIFLGMNRGCKDWNHNRAVRVNDTYAWWTSMLGERIYRGNLPQFPAEDF